MLGAAPRSLIATQWRAIIGLEQPLWSSLASSTSAIASSGLLDEGSAAAAAATVSGRGASAPVFARAFASAATTSSDSSSSSSDNSNDASSSGSVDAREIAKFAALAAQWWDARNGPFAPLHALNGARVPFIRRALVASLGLDHHHNAGDAADDDNNAPAAAAAAAAAQPLAGLKLLDVGCGGGLLAEPLARLGADVTGIDLAAESVAAAAAHAAADPALATRLRYRRASAEALAASPSEAGAYDAVVASEVIEHAADPGALLRALAALSAPAPRGRVVISTLNRTPAAYALAVFGAERVARLVPPGTHDWRRFLTPAELAALAADAGLRLEVAAGMRLELAAQAGRPPRFVLSDDLSVNYIALLAKER